jgi:hypothetical protein
MLEAVMRWSVAVGVAAVAMTAVAGPALAHDGWKKKKRWHHHHHHHVGPAPVYLVDRPVVYAPPRPVYVEPMYYGPPPAPSINLNIPLR